MKFRLVSLMCALTLLSIPATSTAQTIAAIDVAPAAELEPVQQPQPQPQAQPQPASPRPTVAAEYSDAYVKRRKIHLYASFATAPLFVAQYIVGQKLYDDGGSDGQRGAHSALGVGIGALFGVNTVTGVWNLWEARHDPNGRRRRLIHGLSMLGADAGFVATGLLAPGDEGGDQGSRSAHRTVALTSMGVAAGSYVYMLLTR
ncbi:MAG TPA: hypothetical protein VFD21_19270 [Vicinamibacterales bacterium]|nr:hypothetical protein [Vicinamibacterales bacterium]